MHKIQLGELSKAAIESDNYVHNAIEMQQEMQKDHIDNLLECIQRGKKEFNSDFYVVILNKREKLTPNVIRCYFFPRKSCPTPTFDQTVYKYNTSDDNLEFLWTLPDQDSCILYKENKLYVDRSEWELLKLILDFYDGELDRLCATLNLERV